MKRLFAALFGLLAAPLAAQAYSASYVARILPDRGIAQLSLEIVQDAGELRAATVVRLPDTRCQIFADQALTQREGACPTRLPLALDSDAGGLLDLRPHHEAPRSHH